jgi:proteasome lid subunit RPN8/RPN11
MVRHAQICYPKECCGILLGTATGAGRIATSAIACRNAYEGDQKDRFLLDPKDQLAAAATDLANSWPWYSNVVLSVKGGVVVDARCFEANDDQTASKEEELIWPKS